MLHDNARPHSAARAKETPQEMKCEALGHPPYSPDLAPSDFHLCGPFKQALRGRRFAGDDEEKEAVHDWSRTQKFVSLWHKKAFGRLY
jgi:hypothetical protein